MSQEQFLVWIISGGGAAVVLSFVLERLSWFQAQSSTARQYIALAGTLALGLAAYAYLTLVPADIRAAVDPWFGVVAGLVAPWIASQLAHKADPAA